MAPIESICRWEKNPVFWRTESGQVLGFQSNIPDRNTMIISDGKGKLYTAKYGVIDKGKFYSLCGTMNCSPGKRECDQRQDGTVCRYYSNDGEARINGEARYYVEVDE